MTVSREEVADSLMILLASIPKSTQRSTRLVLLPPYLSLHQTEADNPTLAMFEKVCPTGPMAQQGDRDSRHV